MKRIATLIFSLIALAMFGQDTLNTKWLEQMKFRNIGPAGMSGRISAIDVDPKNKHIIYAGAASGGLWRSKNGGNSWQCIFNNEGAASIGALAIDPSNSSAIWVGTGEGNPRNSHTSGNGIYRSLDGGKTWQCMGLENSRTIHRIIVHPTNSDIIYVAALGVAWGENEERGVFKTTNGGQTWEKILYIDEKTGAADLVMDPQNPNKLMAAMWEHRRWPWFFKSGGPGSGLYVTFDGGKTWQQRTEKDGLPKGDLGRIGLAIAPSNSDVVYALVESTGNNALYRSDDGGFKWRKVSEDDLIGNRPFYYADIFVAPNNHNKIYSLWSFLTMSEDGGRTWKNIAPYHSVHPDHHSFWVGSDPDFVIEGNDGGLNISYDAGETWRFVENLPLAQFYHIRVDDDFPYKVYGGMQDNGSWRGPAYVFHAGGVRNSDWRELYFGDGFDVVPDPENNRFVFAQAQEGYVSYVDVETGDARSVRPVHPEGEELRFNWNAAIAQDPFDAATIYFGSQFLHKSTDRGLTWQIISPDLTTNDTAHQKQLQSGGLTYDVTGAENFTSIISIAPSPVEKDVIWVGTDDGNVQVTKDGGESWQNVASKLPGVPEGAWVAQIQPSAINAGEAFVVVNDYRRNNWQPYLLHTTNYGKSFTNLVNEDAVAGYTMSVVQDVEEENLLFLGTQMGLYFSLNKGESWQRWGENFPTVQVADMAIQARESDLVVGTFGRAAWVLDDIIPLRKLAQEKDEILEAPISALSAPTAVQAAWRQADGTRFAADAMFQGDNRTTHARIAFWLNMQEDSAYKAAKKVKVEIFNSNNIRVKTQYTGFKEGLNYCYWNKTEKGSRYPSLNAPPKDKEQNDPSGVDVLPGKYKVRLTYGESADSIVIEVVSDPRIKRSKAAIEENYQFAKRVEKQQALIAEVSEKLREAKSQMELIEQQLKEKEGEEWKEHKEKLKATKDSFEVVRMAIWGKENVEGYFSQPETWADFYGTANYLLGSNKGAVGQNHLNMAKQLEAKTDEVIKMANSFFEKDWLKFVEYFQQNPISLLNTLIPVQNN